MFLNATNRVTCLYSSTLSNPRILNYQLVLGRSLNLHTTPCAIESEAYQLNRKMHVFKHFLEFLKSKGTKRYYKTKGFCVRPG